MTSASTLDQNTVASVIQDRCLDCHDESTSEAGVNLELLTSTESPLNPKVSDLWTRVERVVTKREMPPSQEEHLTEEEIVLIRDFYQTEYILKDNKEHIGPTPLRRLTKYELLNTLEDLLLLRGSNPRFKNAMDDFDRESLSKIIPSDLPGDSGFDNDATRMERLKLPLREIADTVHLAMEHFRQTPILQEDFFGGESLTEQVISEHQAKNFIETFVKRACRANPSQNQQLTQKFYEQYERLGGSKTDRAERIFSIFEMILLSPDFLYRLETSKNQRTPYPVTGMELASRLSYFLWSSTPDQELINHGMQGTLLEDKILLEQTQRLLRSPKSIALSENFAGQWLGFNDLVQNSDYFDEGQQHIESYDEVIYFFNHLLQTNGSILELVDSEWIYRRVSKMQTQTTSEETEPFIATGETAGSTPRIHLMRYRMSDPHINPPVWVRANSERDGGMITTAAIMRLTASKNRTSPIRRGVWILENLVGKHLEPPPNIPTLDDAKNSLPLIENPTVSQLLKQHVSKQECVACHKSIDPLGLGLENYSPTGDWRVEYPNQLPIESTGTMPNGKQFSSPKEMKRILLEIYREEITETTIRRLLAYALGRPLQPYDRPTLDRIHKSVRENQYRIQTAIEEIVRSMQFRQRQDH